MDTFCPPLGYLPPMDENINCLRHRVNGLHNRYLTIESQMTSMTAAVLNVMTEKKALGELEHAATPEQAKAFKVVATMVSIPKCM